MTVVAAADGSALGNPGPAGWGWYVDADRWASGGWRHGTNNMGELTAVLDLLQQTADLDEDLLVLCDSQYAIKSITQWMPGWKRRGWKKGDGKPVANVEIIKALDAAMRPNVRFQWVKGHAGHELNEQADRLANAAAQAYAAGRQPQPGPGFGAVSAPAEHAFTVGGRAEDDLFSLAEEPGDEEQVVALERSLLSDEVRSDPSSAAALLHPDWQEVGRSGRRWSREEMLDAITPLPDPVELEVLDVQRLPGDLVLLVWRGTGVGAGASTLRSSLWQRSGQRWQQRFHQGTPEV
ncbi:ribonuclease HI family protein [uncultured Serinicoccus sp.]|uniref:ribonuclease HI family protein n=1 Tax=uncultured Serinicoccus sp. TaxID=735514 RepID=UPI0026213975|nr:ribonuclease HI family protein [uncultured Serinicoccus sp.]